MLFFAVLLTGLSVYCVIMALFSQRGMQADAVRGRVDSLKGDFQERFLLDEELSQPLTTRFIKPILESLGRKLARLIPRKKDTSELKAQKKKQQDAAAKKQLMKAGLTISVDNLKLLRTMIMIAAAVTGLLISRVMKLDNTMSALVIIGGPMAAYTAVRYIISAMGTSRQARLEHELPDVLDILSISVEAGLGFEQAVQHITENMSGAMVDEFNVTYREMSMGRTRREAMQALAERCDFEDMHTFTGAVIQAGQLGISIKNVLRSQSTAMRQSRKSKAQEKAQKISTKILIPMVIFIFPVLFIILLGPAAVSVVETLG